MRFIIGIILILVATGLLAYEKLNLSYWRLSPEKRTELIWKSEIEKINRRSPELRKAFLLLKDIEMTTSDQQFKDLIDKTRSPFTKSAKGNYTLKLQFMPWIEDMKYGYLIQHEVFESQSQNKIKEFTININIGYLW